MSRVYAPTTLSDVVAVSGLPEDETRRAVYVLALGGLLTRTRRAAPAARRSVEARGTTARRRGAGASAAAESTRPPAEHQPSSEPEIDKRGTVEELLALSRGATHYEVLGVTRSATAGEVKRVYYAHARRLHPDLLRRDADEATRQRIDAAFAESRRPTTR